MFADKLRDQVSQGDIFEGIDVSETLGGREDPFLGPVVLLSHDCEFDKQNQYSALVARVYLLDHAPSGARAPIRSGQALNAVYLPAVGPRPESYVDLRYVHRVTKLSLNEAAAAGRRRASMTDEGRDALLGYLFRFFARRRPGEEAGT